MHIFKHEGVQFFLGILFMIISALALICIIYAPEANFLIKIVGVFVTLFFLRIFSVIFEYPWFKPFAFKWSD